MGTLASKCSILLLDYSGNVGNVCTTVGATRDDKLVLREIWESIKETLKEVISVEGSSSAVIHWGTVRETSSNRLKDNRFSVVR
jgi:hypothetical protein